MNFNKIIFIAVLVTVGLIANSLPAQAVVNLSVNPQEGGSSLRLGRVGTSNIVDKEVRIRITSTDGTQYQVFQRILEPLTSEEGKGLDLGAVGTYTVNGSNTSGTLYAQNPEPMGLSDQLIYTSSPGGDGDSFSVVYSTRTERLNTFGNFLGKIVYTVRPIGSGSQDQVFLNVSLEAKGDLAASIKSSIGRDVVRLDSDKNIEKTEFIEITYDENVGGEIKIYQELETSPQNELFEEIGPDAVQFSTASRNSGKTYHPAAVVLGKRRELVYSSRNPGDTVTVEFALDDQKITGQKSGTYRGRLKYILEGENFQKEFPVDLEVDVRPVFVLDITLPPGGVAFKNVLAMDPPQLREVTVSIKSNLGKAYMVVQNVASPLTNQKGEQVAKEFDMKTELIDGAKGRVASPDFSGVPAGEKSIFFSDNKGSAAQFKVTYRLRSYPEINPGDYSTSIVYSLAEM